MPSKIIVHIGLQKSGTTFLQHMLHDGHEVLARANVRYPVPLDWEKGKRTVPNHEWSSYGLLGTEYPWVSERRAAVEDASWRHLLGQVRAWDGTVLLSAEALSVLRAPAIDRFLDALACDDIHVVVTARSLGRSVPSLWQQHVRNGRSTSFENYLESLATRRDKGREHIEDDLDAHIWRAFALAGLVRRWSERGARQVSLVTTPGRPADLLWQRFAEAVGLPGLVQVEPAKEWNRAHTGLTAPETVVLSSLNGLLRDESWTRRDADRVREIVTERFQTRERRGGPIVIPLAWRERVAEWSRDDLTALRETPARIVGDLEDLRYDPSAENADVPSADETARAGAEAALAIADIGLHESPMRRRARRVRRLLG